MAEPAEELAPGRVLLTRQEEGNLRYAYEMFDDDRSGDLSQGEIIKLLQRLSLVGNKEDAIAMMRRMDENNDGSIDIDEFLNFVDTALLETGSMTRSDLKERIRRRLKLGYMGTTWRSHANIAWMTNTGVVIMASTVVLGVLIYFRFVLVPLTMAYFLTFLIGPLMDWFYQRPLIYGDNVRCLTQYYSEAQAQEIWDRQAHDRKLPTKPNGKPDLSDKEYPIPSRVGNPIPWREGEYPTGSPICVGLQVQAAEAVQLGRLPFVLALLIALVIFCGVLGGTLFLCVAQISTLFEDDAFVASLTELKNEARVALKDIGYVVAELEEAQENATELVSASEVFSELSWVADFINDVALTLLLMLMLLGTRNPRTPERVDREKRNPHSMTVLEKVESGIRNYIMLKSLVSGITGGLVLIALMVLRVRLFFVWGVLTFIFNFIPNIGSILASVLPLSVILVDDELSTINKVLAFAIPAAVQGYVGNVLEPQLFGKSLNLTAISVFIGLVLWGALWGICGAILSVPLLGATKVLLDDSDHPMAKQILYLIKEDNSIEELVEGRGFDRDGTKNLSGKGPSSMDDEVTKGWVRQFDGGHRPADLIMADEQARKSMQDKSPTQASSIEMQMHSPTNAMETPPAVANRRIGGHSPMPPNLAGQQDVENPLSLSVGTGIRSAQGDANETYMV